MVTTWNVEKRRPSMRSKRDPREICLQRHLIAEAVSPLDHVISLHDKEVVVVHDDELHASPRNAICHGVTDFAATVFGEDGGVGDCRVNPCSGG